LLADQPDKAAEYVSDNYSLALQNTSVRASPPPDWIHAIFEMAWPDLQQEMQFCAAQEAQELLLKHVQVAVELLDWGLRDIQKRFEGGDALV
jgi:hypothetical protein